MASIRPLERSDLPAVATLYELVARSGSRTPAPGLERYFEKTFFDHPWADPEIPSLVFVDDATSTPLPSVRPLPAGEPSGARPM